MMILDRIRNQNFAHMDILQDKELYVNSKLKNEQLPFISKSSGL